jgi:hypothetical protein
MPNNNQKDELQEKPVTELVRERGERFHRRGRKPKSPESQRLSKNALRLLRHILKVTPKEDPIWSESVEEVAKGIGHRSLHGEAPAPPVLRGRGVGAAGKERRPGEACAIPGGSGEGRNLTPGRVLGSGEKGWRKRGAKTGAGTKTSAGNSRTQTPFFSRCGHTRAAQTAHSGGGRPALPSHPFAWGKHRPPPKMGPLPWRLCSGSTWNVLDL